MVHHENEQSLLRILGVRSVPADVLDEVSMRTRMFHSDGNSGPLPTIALIDAVRYCGKTRPVESNLGGKVDWRSYPQDGSTHVEAKIGDAWMHGVFLGFVSGGTLMVRVDGIEFVQECSPANVRLAAAKAPESMRGPLDEEFGIETPTLIADDESEPVNDAPFDTSVSSAVAVLKRPVKAASTGKVNRGGHEMADDIVEGNEDWSLVSEGAEVWVEADNDYLDGKFVAKNEDGTLRVTVKGAARDVDPECVRLVN